MIGHNGHSVLWGLQPGIPNLQINDMNRVNNFATSKSTSSPNAPNKLCMSRLQQPLQRQLLAEQRPLAELQSSDISVQRLHPAGECPKRTVMNVSHYSLFVV